MRPSIAQLAIVLAFAACNALAQAPGGVSCPEYVATPAVINDAREPAPSKVRRRFERVSVYNRGNDGREYELAPDLESKTGPRITQTWKLRDYRDMPVFVRCRYRQTDYTISLDIPANISRCRLTFELDKNNDIIGRSTMQCR